MVNPDWIYECYPPAIFSCTVPIRLAVKYINRSLSNPIPCVLDILEVLVEDTEQPRFLPWEFGTPAFKMSMLACRASPFFSPQLGKLPFTHKLLQMELNRKNPKWVPLQGCQPAFRYQPAIESQKPCFFNYFIFAFLIQQSMLKMLKINFQPAFGCASTPQLVEIHNKRTQRE